MDFAQEAHINDYPPERNYVRNAVFASVGIHVLVVIIIGILAVIFHIKSLRDLMRGTIEQSGPAPEEKLEVELIKLPPPPPILNPDFIKQVLKPKIIPPVVPKPKKPAPPKPHVEVKPRFTAPNAHGEGKTQAVSKLTVGSGSFPQPSYPMRARQMHMTGTVVVAVQFDSGGGVANVQIVNSSGSGILDSATTSFIRDNWHDASWANKSGTVPIEYRLQ